MRFRNTWIVLALAAALGGFVLWQQRHDKTQSAGRARAARLLGIERDQIGAVRIATGTQRIVFVQRGGAWYLEDPVPAPADPRAVAAFLDTLAAARREDDVGRGDLPKYGLDAPAAQLDIDVAGRTRHLALGRINPQQTLVYVLLDGDPDVLLTTSALLTLSIQSPFAWREKRVVDVDPETLARIQVRTLLDGELTLRRDPQLGWLVDGPVAWRADPVRARSAVLGLGRLEAVGVAAENKVQAQQHGVDNRRFGVQGWHADGSVAADVVFGFADGSGAYFAVSPESPEIWKVDGQWVDLLVALVRDPRDRRAFPPFDPDTIDRIVSHTGDDDFTLERRSQQDWIVAKSTRADSTFPLAEGVVTALLTDIATLKLQDFPQRQPGSATFATPTMSFELWSRGRRVAGLEIGTRDPQGLLTLARGTGEPAAFLISPADLLRLPIDLDRLKAPETEAPAGADRS